jgi:hypothetical protein
VEEHGCRRDRVDAQRARSAQQARPAHMAKPQQSTHSAPNQGCDCHSPSTSLIQSCRGHVPLTPGRDSALRSRGQRTHRIKKEPGHAPSRRGSPSTAERVSTVCIAPWTSTFLLRGIPPKPPRRGKKDTSRIPRANAHGQVGQALPDRSGRADAPNGRSRKGVFA